MQALRYAIARLAIDFVSGPAGIAGWLRTTLLAPPYNTPSLPLDIGYSDSIPASIRRAVLLRDRGCAWPRCGRPAAWCDVHHLQHKKDGGKTAVSDCVLLCQFHHDICIHRRGWRLILHPDGTTTAYGPGRAGAAQPLTTHHPRRVNPAREGQSAYNAANLAGPPPADGVYIWTCSTASGDDCPDVFTVAVSSPRTASTRSVSVPVFRR